MSAEKIYYISKKDFFLSRSKSVDLVMGYGHFNVIHPGHIRYIEHAKTYGQKLVIALQGDQMLRHSGKSHHFPVYERAFGLAWLNIVDAVLILDEGDLGSAIKIIRPNVLVLGKEYEKDRQIKIHYALKVMRDLNGQVVYHAGDINYSTTKSPTPPST